MHDEVTQLLPLIQKKQLPQNEIDDLLTRLRAAIKQEPALGREYGQLIQQVKEAEKYEQSHFDMDWLPTGGGYLAIGHKPGGKKLSFDDMKRLGKVSAVVTLLQEHEGAKAIGAGVNKAGMEWIWFPFSANEPHHADGDKAVRELYARLAELLKDKAHVYIHCSAGIHRTGMIAYGLLRYLGNSPENAKWLLRDLRDVTAAQVGDDRLKWADQFGA